MRWFGSLLLASAAISAGVANAWASELPAAEPVEFVEVCASEKGVFQVPGTSACLQLVERDAETGAKSTVLSLDRGWGEGQISLALPQEATGLDANGLPSADTPGWSVQTGLKFDLPGAPSGSNVWVQGNYAEGAASLPEAGQTMEFGSGIWTGKVLDRATIGALTNDVNLRQIGAGVDLKATETLRFNAGAAYSTLEQGSAEGDADFALVQGNIFWTPASDLDLSLSVMYSELLSGFAPASNDLSFTARVGRDF